MKKLLLGLNVLGGAMLLWVLLSWAEVLIFGVDPAYIYTGANFFRVILNLAG